MALYFGRDMLKVFKDTAFYESLESLLQKVKTTLPPESIKYLENVEQTLQLSIKPYKDYGRYAVLDYMEEEADAGNGYSWNDISVGLDKALEEE